MQVAGMGGGLAVIGSIQHAAAQGTGPIRIGIVAPLSGPIQVLGSPIRMGAEIAAASINKAGGVAGRQIELVFRDDRSNPTESAAYVRELASTGINLIFCGVLTASVWGAIPVLQEFNAVNITMGAVAMAISHERYVPNNFRPTASDFAQVKAYARFAAERFPDVQNWGMSSLDIGALVDSYTLFAKLAGEEYAARGLKKPTFIDPVLFKIGAGDYRTQINQLVSSPMQGLFNIVYGQDNITYWSQARGFGLSEKLKVILDRGNEYPFVKAMKKNIPANFWTMLVWNPSLREKNPLSKQLYETAVTLGGDPNPGVFLHFGEAAIRSYARAIEIAGGKSDSASVTAAMEGMSVMTANGEIIYRKEDHQAIVDVNLANFVAADNEYGFAIKESVVLAGKDLVEPPTPGKPYIY